jgi:hypothetical protein
LANISTVLVQYPAGGRQLIQSLIPSTQTHECA